MMDYVDSAVQIRGMKRLVSEIEEKILKDEEEKHLREDDLQRRQRLDRVLRAHEVEQRVGGEDDGQDEAEVGDDEAVGAVEKRGARGGLLRL